MPKQGSPGELANRYELYLTKHPEQLFEFLSTEIPYPEEDRLPPASSLVHISVNERGLHSANYDMEPITSTYTSNEENIEDVFCWDSNLVYALREIEGIFDRESIYDHDERGGCHVRTYDTPPTATFRDTESVTVQLQYVTNRFSADDDSMMATLFYGCPWSPEEYQHRLVDVTSKQCPENMHEVQAIVKLAFERNVSADIPLCNLEGFSHIS